MNPAVPLVLETRALSSARAGAAVHDVSLAFSPGALHVLTGSPGSGRNLLLRLLGLLETADRGSVLLHGEAIEHLENEARTALRNQQFGFVFAAPFLLPSMTVLENLAMPLFRVAQLEPEQARVRTDLLLDFIGLGEASQEAIASLGAYSQHCVSLARALAHEPAVVLVECLDGELNQEERQRFAALLRTAAARFGTVIIAAANEGFPLKSEDRVVALVAGRVLADSLALREAGA